MGGGEAVLGLGAAVCGLGFLAVAVAVAVVAVLIRRAARRAASTAAELVGSVGVELAGQAGGALEGAVRRIGQEELGRGWRAFRKQLELEALRRDPEQLHRAVLKLAQREEGRLSPQHVVTELELDDRTARDALERLRQEGKCRLEDEDASLYVFPAFLERRPVKVCDYCDSVYEPDEVQGTCPGCGAPLHDAVTV
ncbi:MAG: hypothetical protein D6731_05545 [Planctomycetota bacterium]|nr:MAG: hypothetical protein D6731_05545 [Planctomycetota bacterium]